MGAAWLYAITLESSNHLQADSFGSGVVSTTTDRLSSEQHGLGLQNGPSQTTRHLILSGNFARRLCPMVICQVTTWPGSMVSKLNKRV